MKKISFLKKIGIGLTPVIATTPLIFSTTGCSTNNAILTTSISFNKFLEDESLQNMSKNYFSNDEILLGSTKFFDGNYILLIGSNAYPLENNVPANTQRFFGDLYNSRNVNTWFTTYLKSSVWWRDVKTSNGLKLNRDFGFVTYIDNFDFHFYDGNREIFITDNAKLGYGYTKQNFGPFDKWTEPLLSQTRLLNEGWDKDEKVTTSDYIRQDDQAKSFRAFMQRGATFFPTNDKRTKTFETSDNNKASLMAVYKDGRLVDIIDMPTKEKTDPDPEDRETSTLYGTINKYFTDEEKKDE